MIDPQDMDRATLEREVERLRGELEAYFNFAPGGYAMWEKLTNELATLREALGPILEQLDRMEWAWQRADGKPDDPQWLKTQKSFYLRIGEARKMKALAATEAK